MDRPRLLLDWCCQYKPRYTTLYHAQSECVDQSETAFELVSTRRATIVTQQDEPLQRTETMHDVLQEAHLGSSYSFLLIERT